ncbi:DEAD/DEAH box helicase [Guggenheimella bovis]
MQFNEIINHPEVLRSIHDKGYLEMTPIQARVIPLVQAGRDLIGQSQTGTGKTAAFAIPTLLKVDETLPKAQVLVLSPTRELAVQTAAEYRELSAYMEGIRTLAVFGGEQIERQIGFLKKGPQIIVATPGRLMDHLRRRTIRLGHVHTIVLDEADEMLRMGFREDVEEILSQIEGETQRLLFSATMPAPIKAISNKFLVDPVHVQIEPQSISVDTVVQRYVAVQRPYKKEVLLRLLNALSPERCMIFANTKRMVDELIELLQQKGVVAERIHGDMKQEHRLQVLRQFNRGLIKVVVATDVAARGLDIEDVDLVINYDLPESVEYYVHRIGRSGRAGKSGQAISILTHKDFLLLKEVEHYIKKPIESMQVPSLKRAGELRIESALNALVLRIDPAITDHYRGVFRKLENENINPYDLLALYFEDTIGRLETVDRDLNDHSFGKPQRPQKRDYKDKKRRPAGKKNYGKPYTKR